MTIITTTTTIVRCIEVVLLSKSKRDTFDQIEKKMQRESLSVLCWLCDVFILLWVRDAIYFIVYRFNSWAWYFCSKNEYRRCSTNKLIRCIVGVVVQLILRLFRLTVILLVRSPDWKLLASTCSMSHCQIRFIVTETITTTKTTNENIVNFVAIYTFSIFLSYVNVIVVYQPVWLATEQHFFFHFFFAPSGCWVTLEVFLIQRNTHRFSFFFHVPFLFHFFPPHNRIAKTAKAKSILFSDHEQKSHRNNYYEK